MSVTILQGDCRQVLATLPDASAHCCVTSPPYFGLRSYLRDDDPLKPLEMGLEETPEEYVAGMVAVFREVWRVLRDDGTLWLNIGDSYSSGGRGSYDVVSGNKGNAASRGLGRPTIQGLKPKDLIGIPWMLAFALRADGWYLRQEVIWHKPNPMPESVTDRCTKAHESLFLLSKSACYHFDADAIAEGMTSPPPGNHTHRGAEEYQGGDEHHRTKFGLVNYAAKQRRVHGVPPRHAAYPDSSDQSGLDDVGRGGKRNKRSVWTVATQPYRDAHFATFPPALIEPCILASCPVGGVVLDPFGGSGTTGMVAQKLGRGAVLIDLNPDYQPMMEKRVRTGNVGLPLEAA